MLALLLINSASFKFKQKITVVAAVGGTKYIEKKCTNKTFRWFLENS